METKKTMGRRAFIGRVATLVGAGYFLAGRSAGASEALDPEILKSQLRAKTEREKAFVDDVVQKASDGILPMKIFTTARRYALQKDASQRVVYFKMCLEALTKRAGLKIVFKSV
ncbi:MAG: hypothetical protein IJM30_13380 [Thermoguttaceae bacterium]|nr:hypothetical protein [Thermoguttaceae bacterium]